MRRKVIKFPDEEQFIVRKKVITDAGLTDFVENQADQYHYVNADAGSPTTTLTTATDPTNLTYNTASTPTGTTGTTSGSSTTTTTTTTTAAVTQCDASIDQFNIYVNGNTVTISSTVLGGTKPISGKVWYQLVKPDLTMDGGITTSTFQLTNLAAGDYSITLAAECADGSTIGKTTKGFTIAGSASATPPADCADYCILNTSGSVVTISSLEQYLGKSLLCPQTTFTSVASNQRATIKLTPAEVTTLNPSSNWEIFAGACSTSGSGGTGTATPPVCDVEITNVAIEISTVATGSNAYFKVSFGGTTNAKPIGVAYSNQYVQNGQLQQVIADNFTLRNLPAGENKVILYPICEGNLIGTKSLTKVFTIAPNPSSVSQTSISPATSIGGGGGGFAAPRAAAAPTGAKGGGAGGGGAKQEVKVSFLQKNWWWLLIVGGIIYLATKDKKQQ